MLLAYIIGSDVTIRAGEAFEGTSYYAGWHLTGTCGVMGAAAGAAKLLGLDVQQTVDALGVAGSAAGGLGAFNSNGSWTKRFHAGQSAMNGVLAATMGRDGYFAPAAVFEDKDGFLNCFSFKGWTKEDAVLPDGIQNGAKLVEDFGKKWEMADNSIKLHSCCRLPTTSATVPSTSTTRAVTQGRSRPSTPSATSLPTPSSAARWR